MGTPDGCRHRGQPVSGRVGVMRYAIQYRPYRSDDWIEDQHDERKLAVENFGRIVETDSYAEVILTDRLLEMDLGRYTNFGMKG
jgi:hypothetical protein